MSFKSIKVSITLNDPRMGFDDYVIVLEFTPDTNPKDVFDESVAFANTIYSQIKKEIKGR